MALRKFLYLHDDGYQAEATNADSLELAGLKMYGNIDANNNKLTNLADASGAGEALVYNQANAKLQGLNVDVSNLSLTNGARITGVPSPQNATDAVNKAYADNIASNIIWKGPVTVINMISDSYSSPPETVLNGDAFVVGANPSGEWASFSPGDIVEYGSSGPGWFRILQNSGGEPPDGTVVIVAGYTASTPSGSFAGQAKKVAVYNATSNSWSFTAPVEGESRIVEGDGGYYEHLGFVYNTSDNKWYLFNGAGQVNAGVGLGKSGNTLYVKLGDGITELPTGEVGVDVTANGGLELVGTSPDKTLSVKLPTNSGLETSNSGLYVKYDGAHGIVVGPSGVELEIDDTPDTLDVDADGLKVVGLPAQFKINGTAVSANVTAPNLDELTGGGETMLHSHPGAAESERNEYTWTAAEALAKGDPIYVTATANNVGKARADTDAKSYVYGIAKLAANASESVDVVMSGRAPGILSGATPGNRYWLASAGGLTTTIPGGGNRIIHIGVAVNATDMIIAIRDFGKKAA